MGSFSLIMEDCMVEATVVSAIVFSIVSSSALFPVSLGSFVNEFHYQMKKR